MSESQALSEPTVALPRQAPALPLAESFFTGALTSHSLAHGYILKGKALGSLYNLALLVARILNCKNPPVFGMGEQPPSLGALACGQCTDCRWVAQNAHPAVLTVSRLTYQVSDKGEDLSADDLEKLAKKGGQATQIKAEQIERLLSQLSLSTEHTRVVIFTNAEERPASTPSDVMAPFEWRNIEANEEKSFHIRPLERRLFNHASANRFLKTLEEPPPRTVFFFIAETEEQILETIVSRCQVVPCQTGQAIEGYLDVPEAYQLFLREFVLKVSRNQDVYVTVREFEAFFLEAQGLTLLQALDMLQLYLRTRYLALTAVEPSHFHAYRLVQDALDDGRRMLNAKVNEGQSLVNLLLRLSTLLAQLERV